MSWKPSNDAVVLFGIVSFLAIQMGAPQRNSTRWHTMKPIPSSPTFLEGNYLFKNYTEIKKI